MERLFGTDGVRGVANTELTAELAVRLGRAAATRASLEEASPGFVIGRDTRISGPMLESSLVAGILSAGGRALVCGIIPTPAVAFLTTELGAQGGAVVSASHNPVDDNGIKFFGGDGYKLSDEQEREIESLVKDEPRSGVRVGSATDVTNAADLYIEHALKSLEGNSLEGLRVVADCANGAAYLTTPEALRRAGAEVIVMNADPDGTKINVDCGSTNTEAVAARVLKEGAHAGLAHDGDADRVIAVDEKGNTVDGDAIIAAAAADLAVKGRLDGNIVVTTVMANLGFREAMKERGIEVIETDVGDRYVVEAMKQRGAVLGGEQSGHVIFQQYATTGDGLITALRLLTLVKGGRPMSEVASIVRPYPQVLVNVRVKDKGVASSSETNSVISEVAASLGDSGRVLVRPSGTEPLVRVMVEATEQDAAQAAADRIAEAIRNGGGA